MQYANQSQLVKDKFTPNVWNKAMEKIENYKK